MYRPRVPVNESVLIDRNNLWMHRRWLAVFLVGTAASVSWWLAWGWNALRWPSGSSLPGLVFGTIAALIMIFEFLLWPRKSRKVRAWRIGRTQVWLRAHIWLGLLTVPLVILHSGFELGGQLSTLLMVIFTLVIASGIFGLAVQQIVPRMMLEHLPAETIHSQIDYIARQFTSDAENLVLVTCGRSDLPELVAAQSTAALREERPESFVVIGAVRSVGSVRGKVAQTQASFAAVPDSEPLRLDFYSTVKPYLEGTSGRNSLLSSRRGAEQFFSGLKRRLNEAAHPAVDRLADLVEFRRQFVVQRRLHLVLHGWLVVHLPLSVALLLLMFVHIYYAAKYW